ncbi:DUF1761 domain-containing protein [Pseudoroseicyclus sp. H15]
MGILGIIAAALAAWLFGAVWYMLLAKPWAEAAGLKRDVEGRPQTQGSALPYVLSVIAMLIVATFMQHIFRATGIATWHGGLTSGLGVGLFFIAPWTMMNYAYTFRPFKLTLIDGGYAVFGCGIMGLVLALLSPAVVVV